VLGTHIVEEKIEIEQSASLSDKDLMWEYNESEFLFRLTIERVKRDKMAD